MEDYGIQMFTEESEGEWINDDLFVMRFGKEVVAYKDVRELDEEEKQELVKQLFVEKLKVKYYKGHSFHYKTEEWDKIQELKGEENNELH